MELDFEEISAWGILQTDWLRYKFYSTGSTGTNSKIIILIWDWFIVLS